MNAIRRLFATPYPLWLVLCLPMLPVATLMLGDNPRAVHIALHPTGEWAARFMIIAMMATPLVMVLRGWRGPRWLLRNRRYFGVAAFAYALTHTILYLIDVGGAGALRELPRLYIWSGWIAMAIFVPLAATSMDSAVRSLGRWWKPLQQGVYVAAVLTLIHWAALHDWGGVAPAMVHFGPLILLSAYRLWWNFGRQRSPRPT